MPAATTSKPTMAGKKRKDAPGKNGFVKEHKKPKMERELKSALKKSVPVKEIAELSLSDEDSSDEDADGGVPLTPEGDEEMEEDLPNAADGLHPDRVKAVVANSECSRMMVGIQTNKYQVNLRRKHMLNKSNWPKRGKLQSHWQSN